eukprot:4556969-Pyramimonas_sp.AAC.1
MSNAKEKRTEDAEIRKSYKILWNTDLMGACCADPMCEWRNPVHRRSRKNLVTPTRHTGRFL